MNHTKSVRTFFGTNAERTAAGLSAFLPGDEFFETDTEATYQHNGMAWVQTGVAAPGGSDAQIQFNDGGAFGGATAVTYNPALGDFRILGDGNNSLFTSDFSSNTIRFGTNGAPGTIASFSPSLIVYNDDGNDVDFRVEGAGFSNLFRIDAGLDAVQIGTAAPGTIADFRSTGVVFNEVGAAIPVRVEGDTDANLLYIDGVNDRVGIGTASPATSAKLEIASTTGALLLPRLTTTQQNALTGVNGMILYNSSTNKFRGYAGGAWVDLH
jgi:hypothetical protein